MKKFLDASILLKKKYDYVLVEGIGGLMVPITKEEKKKSTFYFVRDLIKDLGLSVIIVTRPTLGTINHTLLTLEALKSKKFLLKVLLLIFQNLLKKILLKKQILRF